MLTAPLMAGNDLGKMSEQTMAILTKNEAVTIDQDAIGIEDFRYYGFDGIEIWVKPLVNNELAVCFLNRSNHLQNVNFDWKERSITDTLSKTGIDFNKNSYKLRDLWAKKDLGTTSKTYKQTIGAYDVILLKLLEK